MSGNASNNTTAQEVSPSAVKVQFIRPPKSKKVPQLASKATVLPVKANLDRRLSRSTDSVPVDVLNAGGAPPPAPIPSPAFHAFPTQKTMAEVLALASKTTEQKNDHAKNDSSILGKKGETKSRSSANPSHFPTKEHAFLIQSVESFTIHQYLRAVANLVGASNIWFGSRLSLGRVAVYLSTVKLVDEFMTKHAGIQIGDVFLPARRMVTKANRLVLSNVCPTIPHSTLEDMLGSAMKLVSPMSFVNVGGKDPELSTIYSFRRQIFVVIDESHQLPESLLVEHDGDRYRVFLSFDDLRCFTCRQSGHVARNCPQNRETEIQVENSANVFPDLQNSNTNSNNTTSTNHKNTPQNNTENRDNTNNTNTNTNKRKEHPTSSKLSDSLPDDGESQLTDHETQHDGNINMDTGLLEALDQVEKNNAEGNTKHIIDRDDTLRPKRRRKAKQIRTVSPGPEAPLPFEAMEVLEKRPLENVIPTQEFLAFLGEVKGNDHPIRVAERYTENIAGLIDMLDAVQPKLLKERALRERVRRLIANLRKHNQSGDGDESDRFSLARSTSAESVQSSILCD
jgi:hypothetical protein